MANFSDLENKNSSSNSSDITRQLENGIFNRLNRLNKDIDTCKRGGFTGRIIAKGIIVEVEKTCNKRFNLTTSDVIECGLSTGVKTDYIEALIGICKRDGYELFDNLSASEVLYYTESSSWATGRRLQGKRRELKLNKSKDTSQTYKQNSGESSKDTKDKLYKEKVIKQIEELQQKGYALTAIKDVYIKEFKSIEKASNPAYYNYIEYLLTYINTLQYSGFDAVYEKMCKKVLVEAEYLGVSLSEILTVYTEYKLTALCLYNNVVYSDDFHNYFTKYINNQLKEKGYKESSYKQFNREQSQQEKSQREQEQKRNEQKKQESTSSLDEYYKALGLTSSATMVEVTKSYKELILKFHPDTIANKDLPPEFTEFATKKFMEVQEAFKAIKVARK